MGIQRGLWLVGFCFLGVTLAGCGPPATLFVETTVRADGSCDRRIWQPKDEFLPKQALQPAWNSRWNSVVDATGPHGTPGARAREKLTKFVVRKPEELAKASPKTSDSEGAFQYFIATGSFRGPLDIPPHYRFGVEKPPNAGTSELERSLKAFGRVAIDDEAKATEFIEAVGPDGPLLDAVRKLDQTGERNALRQVETRTFEEGSRARKLRKMLFNE